MREVVRLFVYFGCVIVGDCDVNCLSYCVCCELCAVLFVCVVYVFLVCVMV